MSNKQYFGRTLIKKGNDIKLDVLLEIPDLPEKVKLESITPQFLVKCGNNTIDSIKLKEIPNEKHKHYIIPLDSKYLDFGDLLLEVSVAIPDKDFEDKYRNELIVHDTMITIIP